MISAALFFALVLQGCKKGKGREEAQKPPTPVIISNAAQKDLPVEITAIGSVEAYSNVSVKSLVGGQLMKVYFKEGDEVKKGSLLFKIDPRPYEAALRQAEANLARDTAILKNTEEQLKRYSSLIKDDFVAKENYDQIKANAAAQEATVAADREIVENSRLQLGYCTIRSQIDGRTGSLMVDEGNIIKPNDAALVEINQINPVKVTFTVPEQYLPEIKKYMSGGKLKVEVSIPQEKNSVKSGLLSFIDSAVDRNTGTIKLKGTFENRDKLLWPGQFVNISLLLTTRKDMVIVPAQAVQVGQKGQYVYVIKPDMTAEYRAVTAGSSHDSETIIEKGIAPGEKVVIDGQSRLVPKAKVVIKTMEPAPKVSENK